MLRLIGFVAAVVAIYVGVTHHVWQPVACGVCTLILVAAGRSKSA